ncbi:CBS domain-containing protein [Streptomyces albofaciens JCM 4342]|uniref:CBS domain-containing protein n=1 Tax=Streptomyces albofaciens TaxID=66866 RepID=UPI00123BE49B|nr:CBS domain-containing protein [Streptomyces albofaciens]KAA6212536.1 CBS domain-containing protein [Streptomyces albofaciens JCM 4342]
MPEPETQGNSPRTVGDVMTRTVISIGRAAPFKEIVRTMEQWKVSALPVVEGEGRVVGVVSEADLLPKEEFRDHTPSRIEQLRVLDALIKSGGVTADELMTAPAVTVHADATLAQAARTMAWYRIKRMPVVDAVGRLEGVVSRSDLLKVFLREDAEIAEEVRRTVIGQLFAHREHDLTVRVFEGIVTLSGTLADTALIPVAARLARAVEGVVEVDIQLRGGSGRS